MAWFYFWQQIVTPALWPTRGGRKGGGHEVSAWDSYLLVSKFLSVLYPFLLSLLKLRCQLSSLPCEVKLWDCILDDEKATSTYSLVCNLDFDLSFWRAGCRAEQRRLGFLKYPPLLPTSPLHLVPFNSVSQTITFSCSNVSAQAGKKVQAACKDSSREREEDKLHNINVISSTKVYPLLLFLCTSEEMQNLLDSH